MGGPEEGQRGAAASSRPRASSCPATPPDSALPFLRCTCRCYDLNEFAPIGPHQTQATVDQANGLMQAHTYGTLGPYWDGEEGASASRMRVMQRGRAQERRCRHARDCTCAAMLPPTSLAASHVSHLNGSALVDRAHHLWCTFKPMCCPYGTADRRQYIDRRYRGLEPQTSVFRHCKHIDNLSMEHVSSEAWLGMMASCKGQRGKDGMREGVVRAVSGNTRACST